MSKKLLLILAALFPVLAVCAQNQQTQPDTLIGKHYSHKFIGSSTQGYYVITGNWNPENKWLNTMSGIVRDAKSLDLVEKKDTPTLVREIAEINNISKPDSLGVGQLIYLTKVPLPQPKPAMEAETVLQAPTQPEKPAAKPSEELVQKETQSRETLANQETESEAKVPAETPKPAKEIQPQTPKTGKITGRVLESLTLRGLASAIVSVNGQQALTDADGVFTIEGVTLGKNEIVISAPDYETQQFEVEVFSETIFPDLIMKSVAYVDSEKIPEVNLEMIGMDDDAKAQNISGLLQSSGDVFTSFASYSFGQAWFRNRGYDAELSPTYIGNSMINDAETGRTLWSIWGGLNDATRNNIFTNGLSATKYSFGSIGGVSNIITRPSQQRVQTKLTYSMSNRSYTHRLMFIHSTGLMSNGWAITASGSRRWGEEGYIRGTFYDAWSYYLGLEKKFNDKHSLEFTAFASPVRRGMQGGSVQEIYDLLDNNHYSPNWGFQNGEVRNSRIRTMNQPVLLLNHYWKYNSNTDITTTVSFMFGKTGTTAFNWYNSADPRPDYYRNLPSWFTDSVVRVAVTEAWKTNSNVNQINWNALYQANYLAGMEGKQSRYIIEDRRNDMSNLNLNTVINHRMSENITINRGFELSNYTVSYFKTIEDLLGGEYWVDIDQFAERDFIGNDTLRQNDLENPNRIVKEGDKFGYDYNLRQQSGKFWISSNFSYRKFDLFLSGQISSTTFWREGFMRNGRHPDNSLGKSQKHNFIDYAFKGGITYKFTGRLFLDGNLAYLTQAPFMRNAFVSPRTRDDVSPKLVSEKIFSSEMSVHFRAPMAKARLTAYHTEFKDQNQILTFYHDDYRTLVNHIMYGINTTHQGIEFGGEIHMLYDVWLQAAANIGNYRYTNRPWATIAFDNGSRPDTTELTYLKNFFITGTPQTAAALGLKWVGPDYLFVNLNLNYFDDIYLSFNPERRTQVAIENLGPGDPRIPDITRQEKLSGGYTLDASVGKSFRIMRKYFLQINLSVNNLLNNKNISTGGYEQLRFDFEEKNVDKFPPRYFYMIGTNYFLNVAVRF